MRRFKLHTLVSVATLLIVHLACFAAIVVLVIGIQDNVLDLNNSGEVASLCSSLFGVDLSPLTLFPRMLSSGMSQVHGGSHRQPNRRHFDLEHFL